MIQIELSNPSFESCIKCIYSDDSEETCILRRCIHAVAQLKECYVPKPPTIEPERKKGRWKRTVLGSTSGYGTTVMYQCSECEQMSISKYRYCPNCGARMNGGDEGGET